MSELLQLWDAIKLALREIDAEPVSQGRPYSLRNYAYYYRELFPKSFRNSASEEPITARLASWLTDRGTIAHTELRYPKSRKRCDLVVQLERAGRLWVEVKTAYREVLVDADATKITEPRGKNSWEAGVADVAGKDLVKLSVLGPSDAGYLGILLLGFDREARPLPEDALHSLLPPQLTQWVAAHERPEGVCWPDSYPVRAAKGFRNRAWFWYRSVELPHPTEEAAPRPS